MYLGARLEGRCQSKAQGLELVLAIAVKTISNDPNHLTYTPLEGYCAAKQGSHSAPSGTKKPIISNQKTPMPAYITVNFTPIDKEKMQQYGAAVPATLAAYSGEYLVKGPAEQLLGDTGFQMQVILVFPTKELATGWYHSPEYRALASVRDAGMRAQFQLTGA